MESKNLDTNDCMELITILYEHLRLEPKDVVNAYIIAVREHIPSFDPEALPIWLEYCIDTDIQNDLEAFANQFFKLMEADPLRFLIPIREQCVRTKSTHTLESQIQRVQGYIKFLDKFHIIQ